MALAQDLVPSCHGGIALTRGGLWSVSVCSSCAGTTGAKQVPLTKGGLLSSRKVDVDKLWRNFFSDPSQWWDHRSEKDNPKYPDFKNKKTQQSLWLDSNSTPGWVEAELAAMSPGTLQSNSFSWNMRLRRYVKAGDYKKTIDLFQQMQRDGIIPDKFTFVPVLNACSGLLALEEGKRVHLQIIKSGFECDPYVANSLVDMYAKCGRIADARRVFNKIGTRNVVACNSLILGYVKCGQGQQALQLYAEMQLEGVDLSPVTFVGVLNACASVGALGEGKRAHEQIIDKGYDSNDYVANSLVDMYAKCGSILDARLVYDKMPTRNVVSCNALILGYVKCGQGHEALVLSQQMQRDGMDLDPVSFVGVLNACASIGALEQGRTAHEQIIQRGYECDVYVASSLVDMYAKCGSVDDARRVFNKLPTRDTVSCNALILGYVKCGQGQEALELFLLMERERVDLSPVTFVGVLNACASIGALGEGRRAHEQIRDRGYDCDLYVANSLIDMYAKCGSIEDAQRVFNNMPIRDAVSWCALILGYVKFGQGQQAWELSQQLQQEGMDLSPVTFVGMLSVCAAVGALEEGRRTHAEIIDKGYESHAHVASALIDMYAKCGSIEDAERVFSKRATRDVVSWNVMLAGYCKHGYVKEALQHFERMCQEVEVDAVSFVSLLSACSHGGLVDEGIRYFTTMSAVFNISPTLEHYTCIIDLLGRAGHLGKAEDLIRRMPGEADASVWMSLLGACRTHGNLEMGERIAKRIVALDPRNAAGYVLLSNIYAAAGKWDDVQAIHSERMKRDVKETPECTWIEVNSKVHLFLVNDSNHPQIAEIHSKLLRLSVQMREAGYEQEDLFMYMN